MPIEAAGGVPAESVGQAAAVAAAAQAEQVLHQGGEQEVLRQLSHYEASSAEEAGRGSLIIYTSGTTGKPKGVLHTHR
jgi:acyl-coenzyme A synthetase/AMP-(fatty) acid ligase